MRFTVTSEKEVMATADLHFGHKKMAERRGFDSVADMDAALVAEWNRKVNNAGADRAVVVVAGDFAFCGKRRAQWLLDALRGEKVLVVGNHDGDARKLRGWDLVVDLLSLRWRGHKVEVGHCPQVSWPGRHEGRLHLHGHCHGSLRVDLGRAVDVGVDVWDLGPVPVEWLLEQTARRVPDWADVDHHERER